MVREFTVGGRIFSGVVLEILVGVRDFAEVVWEFLVGVRNFLSVLREILVEVRDSGFTFCKLYKKKLRRLGGAVFDTVVQSFCTSCDKRMIQYSSRRYSMD